MEVSQAADLALVHLSNNLNIHNKVLLCLWRSCTSDTADSNAAQEALSRRPRDNVAA